MIIEPCNCGGLPYVGQLIRQWETLYGVYCMLCGNCVAIEWTENEAISSWNKEMILINSKQGDSDGNQENDSDIEATGNDIN